MLSEGREPSVPHLLGGWPPHPEHRVRRGFLIHAAASLATLLHGSETVNVSRLREQEVQKPDLLISTRLVYTQKHQIVLQSSLGDSPVREPAIFRKILDGMFGIVVVSRHTVMLQEGKEFRLIFQDPLPVLARDLRRKRFHAQYVQKRFDVGLVLAQITRLEPDAINRRHDASEELPKQRRQLLQLLVKGML